MKNISEENEIKLLEYIDGKLSPDEAAGVLLLVEEHPELKARLNELQGLESYIAAFAQQQPSKNFTQQVMSRLDQYPRGAGSSLWKSIVLLAGIFVTAGIASMLVSMGVFDNTAELDLNSVILQNDTMQQSLPSIRFDGRILVNSIIIFNLIIAFFVLDRTVLKPWFQRRSRLHF
jgi:anti-sigma factor RsiW